MMVNLHCIAFVAFKAAIGVLKILKIRLSLDINVQISWVALGVSSLMGNRGSAGIAYGNRTRNLVVRLRGLKSLRQPKATPTT
ncbi:uncharacterized protein VTP21DRAFT_8970 [Calcarisporiella thermophila]|uniref:uncharacterized protein n=1 Tax=Calcarisporiella thermophila TaxID=911321 RepID=UPI003743D5F7